MTLLDLLSGFVVNLLVALLIVRGIYYPARQDKNYVFTFLAFNTVIYVVMSFLTTTEIGVGVGFGLFAIFSILRYRTITMATRDMTYLFVVAALPVVNSVIMRAGSWDLLVVANGGVAAVLFVLEREWGFHYESAKLIKYERIELITPEQHSALLDDLRTRTGLPVKRVEIGRINFLNDSAEIKIYYDEPKHHRRSLDVELGQADD